MTILTLIIIGKRRFLYLYRSIVFLLFTSFRKPLYIKEIWCFMLENKNNKTNESNVRKYVDRVFEVVKNRDPHETEFHQAIKILFESLIPVLVKNSTYIE